MLLPARAVVRGAVGAEHGVQGARRIHGHRPNNGLHQARRADTADGDGRRISYERWCQRGERDH